MKKCVNSAKFFCSQGKTARVNSGTMNSHGHFDGQGIGSGLASRKSLLLDVHVTDYLPFSGKLPKNMAVDGIYF